MAKLTEKFKGFGSQQYSIFNRNGEGKNFKEMDPKGAAEAKKIIADAMTKKEPPAPPAPKKPLGQRFGEAKEYHSTAAKTLFGEMKDKHTHPRDKVRTNPNGSVVGYSRPKENVASVPGKSQDKGPSLNGQRPKNETRQKSMSI